MKPLVIYHADCTDGFAAAFAAWLKLGDEAEYAPMKYGFKPHEMPSFTDREVYMVDFSWPRDLITELFEKAQHVVWLDHHKTAFEMWCGMYEKGMRHNADLLDPQQVNKTHTIVLDDNKSGAYLAWEYFHPNTEVPLLIQHIDDRDRWQWKMEGSAELHAYLASVKPWNFPKWNIINKIINQYGSEASLFSGGVAILRAQKQHVTSMAKQARKCRIEYNVKMVPSNDQPEPIKFFEFRDGLAVNATLHISEVGHELANQSNTFGLVWYLGADFRVKCSLRSNGDYDVSAIARAFGGGGHRNAAGFETDIGTLMAWLK